MASSSAVPAVDHHPTAPPPTPCNHSHSLPTAYTDAALCHLLRQLSATSLSSPPPSRLRRPIPTPPPTISLLEHQDTGPILSVAADHGFFHLADHGVPHELAVSVYRKGASLLHLRKQQQSTPMQAPTLAFEVGNRFACGCLVFDTADADPLRPAALTSFAAEMARIGVACAEMLLAAAGLRNPFSEDTRPRCLMWVSSRSPSTAGLHEDGSGLGRECQHYPHVVCVRYQMTVCGSEDGRLIEDGSGGALDAASLPDTVLVTIGDIAHVWSNGRFKKALMRPCFPSPLGRAGNDTAVMTLMVTLPTDSIISLLPPAGQGGDHSNDKSVEEGSGYQAKYSPFCLEEYACRLGGVGEEDLSCENDPLLGYKN